MINDVMAKIQEFLNADPKQLAKKYPTVDPNQLLAQINQQGLGAGMALGGQGAQLPGQTLGGGGPPVPGATPQNGQGFVLPQDNPFVPRSPDALNLAGYAQASQPGFNVGTSPGLGQGLGTGGPDYGALLKLAAGAFEGANRPPASPSPMMGGGPRPGGGVPAQLVVRPPGLPQIDPQTLMQYIRGGAYGPNRV